MLNEVCVCEGGVCVKKMCVYVLCMYHYLVLLLLSNLSTKHVHTINLRCRLLSKHCITCLTT